MPQLPPGDSYRGCPYPVRVGRDLKACGAPASVIVTCTCGAKLTMKERA
jgi:hypothetical protein